MYFESWVLGGEGSRSVAWRKSDIMKLLEKLGA